MEKTTLIITLALLIGCQSLISTVYPKREPETMFSEMKIYDRKGSPIRSASEDWKGAQERLASNANWREFVEAEEAELNQWIKRHKDRTEWIAGWSNNFVSPVDGSKLIWTEAIPGEEVGHFWSESDSRVEITDKLKAAWVRIFREKHADMMKKAAMLYRVTGKEEYAKWAASQMDFYTDNLLKWEPQRQGARLFWQILTEGVNLITYTETVRLLGDYVSVERKRNWFENFFVPQVEVVNVGFERILNITCWLKSAVAQVGLVFENEAMWRGAIYGEFGIKDQVSQGITSDYLWFEQSMGYNSYVVDALSSLFVSAGIHGRVDELRDEMAVVQNLMLSTSYLRFPDGKLPNPSDTKGILEAPDVELFARVVRIFPTVLGLRAANNRYNWDNLTDPVSEVKPEARDLPDVKSWNLESSRMAVLKEGPWQLFFHYGQPPIKSHLQAEVLNYSIYYEAIEISHDPGTVGYGSPLHGEYYTSGLNHNVLLIDGEGQEQPPKGRKPDPFVETRAGKLIEYDAENATITAAHPVYRKNASAMRKLELKGRQFIDTASVRTNDGKVHKLGIAFHFQGKIITDENFKPELNFTSNRPESFKYWTDVVRSKFKDEIVFKVIFGNRPMKVRIISDGECRVWAGSSPDLPPDRRESLYIEKDGEQAEFKTIIEPWEDGANDN